VKYSEDKIEFSTTSSPHKYVTHSAKEWLDVLKLHWKLSETTMTENESDIIVMHFGKTQNLFVGYFNKEDKRGYIYDRRKEIRVKT